MRAPRVCGAAGKKKIPEIQGTGGNPGKTGSGTHLLPWGCHTIMELVLAALPVETTGALLRTGAMAEIAAILFCSCGYAGTSAALRAFVLFPGYAEVDLHTSWKLETALGKKHDKTEACFWSRG